MRLNVRPHPALGVNELRKTNGIHVMRAFARFAIVAVFVAMDLGFVLPELSRLIYPIGDWGFFAISNVIDSVVPGGPAARAHIIPGDVIHFSSPEERMRQPDNGSAAPYPGARRTFEIQHGNTLRRVTLVADVFAQYPAWFVGVRVFVETFWVALAAFLVLRRPNITTWSFFFVSIFPQVAPIASQTAPTVLLAARHFLLIAFTPIGNAATMMFILSLGAKPMLRWHRVAAFLLVPISLAVSIPFAVADLSWYFGDHRALFDLIVEPSSALQLVNIAGILLWAAQVAVFTLVLRENVGKERQRIVWVFVGFSIYWLAAYVAGLLPVATTPLKWFVVLYTLYGALPACVTYAILKYRLVDINVFISRALIFGIISGAVIAAFSSIDWLFTKELDDRRLGAIIEIAGAIALSLSFSTLHRKVDHIVSATFFRRKHAGEKRLRELAKSLREARSEAVISEGLIDDVVETFNLGAAALFVYTDRTVFRCIHSFGCDKKALADLSEEDVRMTGVHHDVDALVLNDRIASRLRLLLEGAKPDIILPIVVRNELAALAFYGTHRHGEHLDADEIHAISALGVGASAGYLHLQLSELRSRADAAEHEAELLRRELAAMRAQARLASSHSQ